MKHKDPYTGHECLRLTVDELHVLKASLKRAGHKVDFYFTQYTPFAPVAWARSRDGVVYRLVIWG